MGIQDLDRDLKADLKLNRYALEKEAERQPELYLYWSNELAEAKAERDKLKTRLGLTIGEREIYIRNNPPEGQKITEGVIKALVAQDAEIYTAQKKLDAANKYVNTLDGVCRALEQKKDQIKNLTHLSISGYYSRPEGSDRSSEAGRNVKENLNKK